MKRGKNLFPSSNNFKGRRGVAREYKSSAPG